MFDKPTDHKKQFKNNSSVKGKHANSSDIYLEQYKIARMNTNQT